MEYSEHVDLEHSAPLFGLSFCDGAVEPEACVGDEDIHGAEVPDRARYKGLAGCGVGNVGSDGECSFAELRREAVQAIFAPCSEYDVTFRLREQTRRGLPDAARGSRYDRRLAAQSQDSSLSASSCSRRMMWPLRLLSH